MNNLFSERFRSARILNGFSLQDLADALDNKISRQALHKYEKGEVIPDSDMIYQLSKALHVQPDFFFRDTKIELGNLEFRKQTRLPVKEQSRIVESTKDILSRYLELEEILGIGTLFNNPLKDFPVILSFEDIDKSAHEVRSSWNLGIDPIYNTIELLEDNHIKVVSVNSEDSFDGMQTWLNDSIPVIVINKSNLKSADRVRFTVLHELGHLLLPLGNLPEKVKERYCNQFAAAMLIPKLAIEKELGVARKKIFIQELGELKKQYGISIQALIYRCKDLNIISENHCNQLASIIVQNGWKVVEPEDYKYTGLEESNRFTQLLFRALAEELVSLSKAAVLNNQSLIDFRKQIITI
ncbi:MAG TPA: XRE family transcriptional regulator [Dysgonomonas sp.]|uniref:helix-turn-helix domain-containing protein n=1 Tax=unclassified Dysgonomonas TaxID=2630389 RepID=UPI0025B9D2FE|nr:MULTISPECIES: XRE family transcriptional regulator [unclassified Dysgonomonas]HML65134.1 XRE family transcriptional regulator [Dysgonomonas sp.]